MRGKHLEADQVFDCAIDHIEGKASENDCSCESCSSNISRAHDLTLSLRSAALEDIGDIPPDLGILVKNRQKHKNIQRKKRIIISTAGLLAAACIAIVVNIAIGSKMQSGVSDTQSALMVFSTGEVFVNGKPVQTGVSAKSGDVVETKSHSSCAIQFGNSSLVALCENTMLTISKIGFNNNKPSVVLNQSAGITFNKVLKNKSDYSVVSKSAAAVVSGTSFTFSTKGNRSEIKLLHGRVDVSSVLRPGEHAVLEQGKAVSVDEKGISSIKSLDADETKQLAVLDTIAVASDKKNEMILQPEVLKILTEELNADKPVTLADIEKQYGVLSRVETWNGKVFVGAFIRQGSSARLITPNGEMHISIKDVSKISEYTIK
jgi:hypothetical protein